MKHQIEDTIGAVNNRLTAENNAVIAKVQPKPPVNRRKPAKVKPEAVEEDEILSQIQEAANTAYQGTVTLTRLIQIAAENDIDRDDVLHAVIEGGYNESTARSMVCRIYGKAGKGVRAKGGGKKAQPVPEESAALLDYVREEYGERAMEILKGAVKLASKEEAKDSE